MAEQTGISWTRSSFNPWIGCAKVGPGCDHCYAESEDKRRKWGGATHWGAGVPRMRTKTWEDPRRWNRAAAKEIEAGVTWGGRVGFWPVFCASLADVFDNEVDETWRTDLWRLLEETPNLTWQLVTKRVGNVEKMVPASWMSGFPSNVWLISTMVNQEEFDRDWEKLRRLPARVRALSVEPMLGRIEFPPDVLGSLHWAIFGGESSQSSGPSRETTLWWFDDAIRQCRKLGVVPFIKQLGSRLAIGPGQVVSGMGSGKRSNPEYWPLNLRVQEFPK